MVLRLWDEPAEGALLRLSLTSIENMISYDNRWNSLQFLKAHHLRFKTIKCLEEKCIFFFPLRCHSGLNLQLTRQGCWWALDILSSFQSIISTTYLERRLDCLKCGPLHFLSWKLATSTLAQWTLMRVKIGLAGWKVNVAKELAN